MHAAQLALLQGQLSAQFLLWHRDVCTEPALLLIHKTSLYVMPL